jgi:hypothetical protein
MSLLPRKEQELVKRAQARIRRTVAKVVVKQ